MCARGSWHVQGSLDHPQSLDFFIRMKFNIIEVISIIACLHSMLLALFFFKMKDGNRTGNRTISCILFLFVLLIACSLFLTRGASENNLKVIMLASQSSLLMGPLIYFYFRSNIDNKTYFKKHDLIHLIPFFIVVFYLIYKFYIMNDFIIWRSTLRRLGSGTVLVQNLIYLALIIHVIKSHNISFNFFSIPSQGSHLTWLRFLLIGYVIIWIIQIHIFLILDLWNKYGLCPYLYSLYFCTAFILLTAFLYLGLRKPKLFSITRKYLNSSLGESDKEIIYRKLLKMMQTQKPYLDSSITLSELAQSLSVAPCYLSQVINEKNSQNFCNFINKYRIQESIQLLNQPDGKINILEIAYKVGFNSKSAFNNAFRKHQGITPTLFKKGV